MDIIGISVYFTVILAGVLLGLAVGIGILSFAYTRRENKQYKDKVDFVMGYSEKENKKKNTHHAKNEDAGDDTKETEGNQSAETEDTNVGEQEEKIDVSAADTDSENEEGISDKTLQQKHKKIELKNNKNGSGILEKRMKCKQDVSFTDILCEESSDEKPEFVHKKLKTQDSKYHFPQKD